MRDDVEVEPRWHTTGQQELYRGWMTLTGHTVLLPDGSSTSYEVDSSVPFAVATLIYDGEQVFLSRQYRYPIDQWIYDLPGGGGELGEEPVEAARREVEEELGLIPENLRPLHVFFSNPARAAWPTHLFFSTSVSQGQAQNDPIEQVRLARMTLEELDLLIFQRKIIDPSLLVARTMAAATGLMPVVRSW
ncbi:NUDIX domain-containing protein [Psychromicrobium lacuslunae]|uniref:NTP pyrophosphohydrolase n=1 Tax=Psychromicrobium lacuslunae TaxID=1618207 RepID=A0A0D4BXE2_9MICC|nr:NUDIX domain-containing protein [Psychromicrobium lacuslunae]AJT40786.1 NTP pyrophosphohydrolase [Psychromicrobium lacuslunae]